MPSSGGLTPAGGSRLPVEPVPAEISLTRRLLRTFGSTPVGKWLRKRWLALPSAVTLVGLHAAHVPAVWTWHTWSMRVAVAAVGVRVLLHTIMRYGRLASASLRGEWVLFVLMSADLGISTWTGDPASWPAAVAFFGLACVYDIGNSHLVAVRDKRNIPTATAWLARRSVEDVTVEEALSHNQGGMASVAANELVQEATGASRKLSPAGGSAAGGLLVVLLSYGGFAYASSSVLTPSPSHSASVHDRENIPGYKPGSKTTNLTYDQLCAPKPRQPGDGAPRWARQPLNRLWFAGGQGVGGYLAGCAQAPGAVPGHADVIYQIGLLNGEVAGVGVVIHYGPATVYLGSAASRVLSELRAGTVVIGPNGAHIAPSQLVLLRLRNGSLYVPPPTK